IAADQIRTDLRHILGNQTKGNLIRWIDLLLVTESDWLQREKRFASFIHWLDFIFVPPRRSKRSKLTVRRDLDAPVGHDSVIYGADKGICVRGPAGSDSTDGNHISIA